MSYCKISRLFFYIFLLICSLTLYGQQRYVGGDVSLLPKYEEAGAQYKTHEGQPIADVLTYCHDEGMNAMRVRVFVNPDNYDGNDKDPNACQTIESVIPLCKRIKDCGMDLVLDFMYSDTWADPGKQWTPKQWLGLDDDQLCQAIHDYTADCLQLLKDAGATPDFIQTGNEISYGMLWGAHNDPESKLKKCFMGSSANWVRFGKLLTNAISACREQCPEAKIIIHTERVAQPNVQANFYRQMKNLNIDYDIIGISYYPYFHGSMNQLDIALNELASDFGDKRVMVVETGYPYKWPIPGTSEDVDYAYSDSGQNQFIADLIALLKQHQQVDGLFWWWMEYNAYGTTLSGWYNAPLFDSTTGRATSALRTLCTFADNDSGLRDILENAQDEAESWYDLQGRRVSKPAGLQGIVISSHGSKFINNN